MYCRLTSCQPALYQVPVRRARDLPPTSFRPCVTATPLSLAMRFPPLGRARDLHPLEHDHAVRTTRNAGHNDRHFSFFLVSLYIDRDKKEWINHSIIPTVQLIRNSLMNQNNIFPLCATKIISFLHIQNFFALFLKKMMISPKKAGIEQLYAINVSIGNFILFAVDAVNNQRYGSIARHIARGTEAVHRDV